MALAPLLLALLTAAPAPATLEIAPRTVRPGDAILVTVRHAVSPPSGSAAGRPLAFWRAADGWRALAALPSETAPGPLAVEVTADGAPLEATALVVDPRFRATTLHVAPKFVEPPPEVQREVEEDRAAFAQAWEQPFEPPLFASRFAWPRRARVTGRFGDQRVLNGEKESVHYGLDLGGRTGAPVSASNDGRVVLARDCYMSGRTVVLWHGAGVFTVYFHLSRVQVAEGDVVRRGQRIGLLGGTGRATGPHLHWGVRVDGLYVDPESMLRLEFRGATAPAIAGRPPARLRPAPPAPAPAPVPATAPAGPTRPVPATATP